MDAVNPPPPTPVPAALPPAPTPGGPVPAVRGSSWLPRFRWWHWALLLCLAPIIGVISFFAVWAGTFDIAKLGEMPQRATVYDLDGNPYSTLRVGENRTLVRHRQGVAAFPRRPCRPGRHAFLFAPRGRSSRHRPRDRAQHHPPPRRRGGQHAHPATRPQQFAARRQDAHSQNPGSVRRRTHRAALFQAADSRILRQPHLLRRRDVRHRDGQPGVLRQAQRRPRPVGERDDGGPHSFAEPFLALEQR